MSKEKFVTMRFRYYPTFAFINIGILLLVGLMMPSVGYSLINANDSFSIFSLFLIIMIAKLFIVGITYYQSDIWRKNLSSSNLKIMLIESILIWFMFGLIGNILNGLSIWSFSIEWILLFGMIFLSNLITTTILHNWNWIVGK